MYHQTKDTPVIELLQSSYQSRVKRIVQFVQCIISEILT